MSFERPLALVALAAVPLLVVLWLAQERSGVARVLSALGIPHLVLSTQGDWLRAYATFVGTARR